MTGRQPSGGCQCGAVRFTCSGLGRASICHCRMCQKAFGSFFGPLVTARDLRWTRGSPSWFASSNKVRRGFCKACGTPLAYDWGGGVEVAIGALDEPERAAPAIQVNPGERLSFFAALHELPVRPEAEREAAARFMAGIVGNQHPDRDTEAWPQESGE